MFFLWNLSQLRSPHLFFSIRSRGPFHSYVFSWRHFFSLANINTAEKPNFFAHANFPDLLLPPKPWPFLRSLGPFSLFTPSFVFVDLFEDRFSRLQTPFLLFFYFPPSTSQSSILSHFFFFIGHGQPIFRDLARKDPSFLRPVSPKSIMLDSFLRSTVAKTSFPFPDPFIRVDHVSLPVPWEAISIQVNFLRVHPSLLAPAGDSCKIRRFIFWPCEFIILPPLQFVPRAALIFLTSVTLFLQTRAVGDAFNCFPAPRFVGNGPLFFFFDPCRRGVSSVLFHFVLFLFGKWAVSPYRGTPTFEDTWLRFPPAIRSAFFSKGSQFSPGSKPDVRKTLIPLPR